MTMVESNNMKDKELLDNVCCLEGKQAIHESVFDNKFRVLNEKDNEIQLPKKDLVIKSETIILHKDNQRNSQIYFKYEQLLNENTKLKKVWRIKY